MSLQEFVKIKQEPINNAPKRFTSNRVENKKKQYDEILMPKRQFNPRKPPFNFIRKSNVINIPKYNNFSEFPELK